jgi:hypothetical protein
MSSIGLGDALNVLLEAVTPEGGCQCLETPLRGTANREDRRSDEPWSDVSDRTRGNVTGDS